MSDHTWVTPVAAGQLIASHLGPGSVSSGRAQMQILEWVLTGKVTTLALEAVRYEDAIASPPAPRPEPSAPTKGPDGELVAFRVAGGYRPAAPSERPLQVSKSANYLLTSEDWRAALDADTMFECFWSNSELAHALIRQRHPHARVEYSGIRLSQEDVERRIFMAGWAVQAATRSSEHGVAFGESPPADNQPQTAWSVATMDEAIASCGFSNREKAWLEHFKPKRHEHGWSVEAFRNRWPKARGTEGLKGRPRKTA